MYGIDDIDRRLLELLQEDSRQGLDALGHRVSLSAPAVQRRIRRMKESGVIEREMVEVNAAKVGMPMTFIVLVELEREHSDKIDKFKKKAEEEPLVQQSYYVTGETDFVLVVIAHDMAQFEALTRRLFFDDANVRRFSSSVVMGNPYRSMRVPIYFKKDEQ